MKNEKIITYSNFRSFAYSNDKICKKPFKGIVLHFNGLNYKDMISEDNPAACFFAERGIVYIVPYMNPWAWMNKQTVSFVDELTEVMREHYQLADSIPVVASGGSMGGQQALVYTAYTKQTPVACVANCPVCDMLYHYTERPDLPRTMYSAFGGYDVPLKEAIRLASPLHIADTLPDVKYYIFHCEADTAVNIDRHSEVFVERLKAEHSVMYHKVPGKGHCDLTPEMHELYNKYIVDSIYSCT